MGVSHRKQSFEFNSVISWDGGAPSTQNPNSGLAYKGLESLWEIQMQEAHAKKQN